MVINTRDFGQIEINEEDIITFKEPIYGFEDYRKFVFIYEDDTCQLTRLQSIEEKDLCFILANPDAIKKNYKINIPQYVRKTLDLKDDNYDVWLITVIKEDIKASTVNMKSPVIVNVKNKTAMQTILEEDYPIRFPLFGAEKEED